VHARDVSIDCEAYVRRRRELCNRTLVLNGKREDDVPKLMLSTKRGEPGPLPTVAMQHEDDRRFMTLL
jgi:hypothetical protein